MGLFLSEIYTSTLTHIKTWIELHEIRLEKNKKEKANGQFEILLST